MKELSIEEKAKRYDEALKVLHKYDGINIMFTQDLKEEMFPELREEYEDEKTRKELLAVINDLVLPDEQQSRFIDWLEKQGEHANFRNKIQIGDKVTRNEDGVLVNLSQLRRVAKKDEKQGEQKPVKVPKFKVGDFIQFNGMGHTRYTIKEVCGLSHYVNTCDKRMDMSYTDANFELVEQKPWSEVDEQMLEAVLYDCENTLGERHKEWLKTIKDRVLPQTKQEWSEEDENRINRLIAYFEDKDIVYANWLKSLRPQNRWKPSESDILLLERIANGKSNPQDFQASLYNLIEQLKKLREK